MKIRVFAAIAVCTCLPAIFAADAGLKSGIDESNVDPAVRAQDDLFRHVNGKWLKNFPIPADRPAAGAFFELRDQSEKHVLAIIEEADKAKDDADARKIADLYASFMDEGRANKLGMQPIQVELDAIASIKDKAGLVRDPGHLATRRNTRAVRHLHFGPIPRTHGKTSSTWGKEV